MLDYLRKSSEAFIILMVVVSPWAFGCVHPIFRYGLTGAIVTVLSLWAIELFIERPRGIFTKFQWPMVGLIGIVMLQMVPLGPLLSWVAPNTAALKQQLEPTQPELLADGTPAAEPSIYASPGRISFYPAETMRRLLWLVQIALLFTRVQQLATTESLKRLSLACLINGSLLSYFAIIQNVTTDGGLIYWAYETPGASFGPFVNRNHFAFYMNICFGLSLALLGARQAGKRRKWTLDGLAEGLKDTTALWMLSVLVFMLASLILCSSRGGLLSLVGGLLFVAIVVGSTQSTSQGAKWFALAAILLGVAAVVQISLGFDFVASRYSSLQDNRGEEWWRLLPVALSFRYFGTGYGTLPYIEPASRVTWIPEHYLEQAHSEYLHLLVETGVPGLICGVWLLVLLFARILRRVESSRQNTSMYIGLLFALCTCAAHSLAEFALAVPAVAVLLAVVFGHISGIDPRAERRKAPVDDTIDLPGPRFVGPVLAVGLIGFSVMALANAKLVDLAERSRLAAGRAAMAGDLQNEVRHHLRAAQFSPYDAELRMEASRQRLTRLGDAGVDGDAAKQQIVLGLKDAVVARDMSPLTPDAHVRLGENASRFSVADPAITYYQRAAASRPSDPALAFILGEALIREGQLEEAADAFRVSLAGSSDHLYEILDTAVAHFDFDTIENRVLPNDPLILSKVADRFEKNKNGDIDLPRRLRQRGIQSVDFSDNKRPWIGYVTQARLHVKLGNIDEARQAYNAALRYRPDTSAWRIELGQALLDDRTKDRQANLERAKKEIDWVLRRDPGEKKAELMRQRIQAAIIAEMESD